MISSGYSAISSYRSIQAANFGAAVDLKGVPGTLAVWWRADLGVTTVAGKVSSWIDQSANAIDLTQSTAGNRPTLTSSNSNLNSMASVEFAAATPTVLRHASSRPIATDAARTIFAVCRPTDSTGGCILDFDLGVTGFAFMWFLSAGTTYIFTDGVAVNISLSTNPTFLNTARVNTTVDPGPGVLAKFDSNKAQLVTVSNVPAETAGSGLSLGARGTAGITQGFTGSIAEVIVYSGVLAQSSIVMVQNYLHQRYGIAA